LPYLEGNNHVIYGLFADRLNKLCGQDCDKNGDGSCVGKCQENVSLFGGMIQKVSNLTFENIFLSGKKHVYPISSARIYDVVNCHAKNGGIIADASAAGLGYEIFYSMENCTSNLRIKQNETTTSSSSFAGLCFSVGTIKNCVNYGDVIASKKISYMGGFCVSLYEEMNNCINYGNIILDETAYSSGVGGLVGSVNSAKIINCKNYGKVSGEKSLWNVKAGGLAGWLNPNGSPAIVVNCINYGEITNGCGFAGQGMVSSFFNCINYGNIKKLGCAFVYKMFTEGSMVAAAQSVINCVNYGEIENTEKTQFGVLFTNFNFKSSLDILNCQNYGTISGVSSSDIVDFFGTIEGDSKVNIVNFRQKSRISNSNNSDFYLLSSVKENSTCLIKTSYFEFQNTSAKFVSNINQNAALKMYNIVLISQHGANANYFLMNDVSGLLVLENIIIQRSLNKSFSKTTKDPLCKVLRATASINYNNVLIESIGNDKTRKEYVGNDFNDFYFSWKTGKIGLIALDGRGQFQGAIDEDWLKGRGYEKREV